MPTHIKDLLKDFINKSYKNKNFYETIENIIKNSLDKKILRHIKLKRVYKNRLLIYCDNSAALYELNLKKNF